MSYEFVPALAAFAFVSSITPGPNNLMLMASGANFGIRRTIPHALGVAIGFVAMVVLVGVGLIGLFDAFPVSYTILKILSVVYLLYLAWRIANADAPDGPAGAGKPMTFFQAAVFQWVNPKAWAMALTAITVYAPTQAAWAIVAVAIIFGAINLPSIGLWAWMGVQVRRILSNPVRLRVFNITMAVLLIVSLYPFLLPARA